MLLRKLRIMFLKLTEEFEVTIQFFNLLSRYLAVLLQINKLFILNSITLEFFFFSNDFWWMELVQNVKMGAYFKQAWLGISQKKGKCNLLLDRKPLKFQFQGRKYLVHFLRKNKRSKNKFSERKKERKKKRILSK